MQIHAVGADTGINFTSVQLQALTFFELEQDSHEIIVILFLQYIDYMPACERLGTRPRPDTEQCSKPIYFLSILLTLVMKT